MVSSCTFESSRSEDRGACVATRCCQRSEESAVRPVAPSAVTHAHERCQDSAHIIRVFIEVNRGEERIDSVVM